MYRQLIAWLQDDRSAWGVVVVALVIVSYIAFH